jgi:Peptidase family M28
VTAGAPPPAPARAGPLQIGVDPERIRSDVEAMARPRGRTHAPGAMEQVERFIARRLVEAGWQVERLPFAAAPDAGANLLASREPADGRPVIVVAAHFDSVPDSPGADDNASGVAGLLELARVLGQTPRGHRLLLAALDMEETGLLGARALVQLLRGRERVTGAIVFECIGYRSEAPGSQLLPPGTGLLYPRDVRRLRRRGFAGDWCLVAYRRSSTRLRRELEAALREVAGESSVFAARDPLDIPIAGGLISRLVPAARHMGRSDHVEFWRAGLPAIQVTDTANFRNPHYHRPSDTPDTLSYGFLAGIVAATAVALERLGDGAADDGVRMCQPGGGTT